jgi:hypothetical protein
VKWRQFSLFPLQITLIYYCDFKTSVRATPVQVKQINLGGGRRCRFQIQPVEPDAFSQALVGSFSKWYQPS